MIAWTTRTVSSTGAGDVPSARQTVGGAERKCRSGTSIIVSADMSQKMLHATYARQATSRIGAALDSVGSCFPGSRRRDPAAGVPRSGAQPAPCRRSCRRTVTGGRGGRKPVPDPVPRSVARSSPGSPRGPCAPPRKRKRYRLRWERGSALPDGTSNGAHWENLSASGTAKARFRGPVSLVGTPRLRGNPKSGITA